MTFKDGENRVSRKGEKLKVRLILLLCTEMLVYNLMVGMADIISQLIYFCNFTLL